jgi:hypothetical protein
MIQADEKTDDFLAFLSAAYQAFKMVFFTQKIPRFLLK